MKWYFDRANYGREAISYKALATTKFHYFQCDQNSFQKKKIRLYRRYNKKRRKC